jgi:hypothetical protein
MESKKSIFFDEDTFVEFVRSRNKAVIQGRTEFLFQNNQILVDYADLVIDYLGEKFPDIVLQKSYVSKN